MLGKNFLNADPGDSRLLATEAPFGPLVLQEAANEVRRVASPPSVFCICVCVCALPAASRDERAHGALLCCRG